MAREADRGSGRVGNGAGISRRGLLGGAAAGAAGIALGGVAGAESRGRRARNAEVVVVGAGLAGLAAARRIAAKGHSVAVLEARDRVGGRTLNHHLGGGKVVEIGGEWVGPTQDRVLKLAKQLGLKTFKTYNKGENVYFRSGAPIERQTYTGAIPPANPASLAELALALQQLDTMALEVPLDRPWKAPRASEWDSQTFETWKLANTTLQETHDLIDLGFEAVWAAEPKEVSLLHALFYIHSAGSFENLINTDNGAQEQRIVGGSQRISIEMAKRLGSRVVLEAPVLEIQRRRGGVEVRTPKGTWAAKRVIVSVPPTLAGRIRYHPPLPAQRDQLTQRLPMGSVIKCMAIYDRPFWRDEGLTGQATSNIGAVRVTFDNSPPGGRPGILLGFMEGHQARLFAPRSVARRRAAVLDDFVRYFGPKARRPRAYIDKSWADDPWTRGCYEGFAPPGVLTEFGEALRAPVGRIHWAGTEVARYWNGYMDGAVDSGYRAADEVLKAL